MQRPQLDGAWQRSRRSRALRLLQPVPRCGGGGRRIRYKHDPHRPAVRHLRRRDRAEPDLHRRDSWHDGERGLPVVMSVRLANLLKLLLWDRSTVYTIGHQMGADAVNKEQQVVEAVFQDIAQDVEIDRVISMHENVAKSDHAAERHREWRLNPAVPFEEIEQLTVRPRLAKAQL
jgi:hypothetical protein